MTRPNHDEYFLKIAEVISTRSTCLRRTVGCVLVDERNHILATGYNGVAPGLPHCNEPSVMGDACWDPTIPDWKPDYHNACEGANSKTGNDLDKCQAIHAEQNALIQCQDAYKIDVCYCTTAPCIHCVKLLMVTSCRRIVFLNDYAHAEAEKMWVDSGLISTKDYGHAFKDGVVIDRLQKRTWEHYKLEKVKLNETS